MYPICYRCAPPQILFKSIAKALAEALVPIQKCLATATAFTILPVGGSMAFHVLCSNSLKKTLKNLCTDILKHYQREYLICHNVPLPDTFYYTFLGGFASYISKSKNGIIGGINNALYTAQNIYKLPIPDWVITIIIEHIDLLLASVIKVDKLHPDGVIKIIIEHIDLLLARIIEVDKPHPDGVIKIIIEHIDLLLARIIEVDKPLEFLENSYISKLIPNLDIMFFAALLEMNLKIYAIIEPYLNKYGDDLYQSDFYKFISQYCAQLLDISSNLTYVELCIKDSSSFECESAYWNRLSGESENHIDN